MAAHRSWAAADYGSTHVMKAHIIHGCTHVHGCMHIMAVGIGTHRCGRMCHEFLVAVTGTLELLPVKLERPLLLVSVVALCLLPCGVHVPGSGW